MRVLVVGGAGYIGSHMSKMLAESGHQVTVCDNLSTGHQESVQWGRFAQCQLADTGTLGAIFAARQFDAVMHFAANSIVAESLINPLRYYQNNVAETIALLSLMRQHGVEKLVFSSTAAVYGEPEQRLIDESQPNRPINPYGRSKLIVEQILSDVAAAHQVKAVSLRYFNAAGADESGLIGESHQPETHLIPRILRRAAGEAIDVKVYGVDYPTPDGTCVRDYVHVNDLCSAHLSALELLDKASGFQVFNLGNGHSHSVKQVVAAVQEVIGRKLGLPEHTRRPGDPAYLVACSKRAQEALSWTPRYVDIREIVESAWNWHLNPAY
jgi:UDP-glucose 4-epimerase